MERVISGSVDKSFSRREQWRRTLTDSNAWAKDRYDSKDPFLLLWSECSEPYAQRQGLTERCRQGEGAKGRTMGESSDIATSVPTRSRQGSRWTNERGHDRGRVVRSAVDLWRRARPLSIRKDCSISPCSAPQKPPLSQMATRERCMAPCAHRPNLWADMMPVKGLDEVGRPLPHPLDASSSDRNKETAGLGDG